MTMKEIKWSKIDWKRAEESVAELQLKITEAVKRNDLKLVKRLQKALVKS
jgi:uncharacterized membrane protein (DUF106 family)